MTDRGVSGVRLGDGRSPLWILRRRTGSCGAELANEVMTRHKPICWSRPGIHASGRATNGAYQTERTLQD
jgi:hypothetical protein